jgi:hypothetical protein
VNAAGQGPANLYHAWVLSEGPSDKLGRFVDGFPGRPCLQRVGSSVIGHAGCRARQPSGYMHAVYHPSGQFWALQGIETALFGGTALALILFAAWWTQRRVA